MDQSMQHRYGIFDLCNGLYRRKQKLSNQTEIVVIYMFK